MRLTRFRFVLALLPLLACAGCPTIRSSQPLGEETARIEAGLDGSVWLGVDGFWRIDTINAENGVAALSFMGLAEKGIDSLKCEPPEDLVSACSGTKVSCHVWRHLSGTSLYFMTRWPASREGIFRTDLLLERKGSTTVISYGFKKQSELDKRLTELIQERRIPGRITPDGGVVLGPLSSDHYKLLTDRDTGVVDWEDPMPFIRLPDQLNPCKTRAAGDADTGTEDSFGNGGMNAWKPNSA